MRIVSTVPSATEIVCSLGLLDSLVGVSYGCDYPPEVRNKPVVVESTMPRGLSSREIHEFVSRAKREGKSYFRVRYDLIEKLEPDLVIFQGVCDVCAVSPSHVGELSIHIHKPYNTMTLSGGDIGGIMEDIRRVGEATDRREEARHLILKITGRIEEVSRIASERRGEETPRVLFLEWLDPPMVGGHWVPEMIKLAGGEPVLAREGEPSRVVSWTSILRENPDYIILGPCGYHVVDTLRELESLRPPRGWWELDAVRESRVYLVEASHYFSRPGPRIVNGVELLSDLLWGTSLFSDQRIEAETHSLAAPWLR